MIGLIDLYEQRNKMSRDQHTSEFLDYLASCGDGEHQVARMPSLNTLSDQLEISVSRLREQLEVARALGLVEVKPRTGIKRRVYTFAPAVKQSLFYAIQLDRSYFEMFSELRVHIEASYWYEAVRLLTQEDLVALGELLACAWQKLNGAPVVIPQAEHREFHLLIYRRLNNPFVQGILEAYWDAYEAVGLNVYADIQYLRQVWKYHESMVQAIRNADYETGYQALIEHADLIFHRPESRLVETELTTK